jgi:hypothetical protein
MAYSTITSDKSRKAFTLCLGWLVGLHHYYVGNIAKEFYIHALTDLEVLGGLVSN